jgi:hypothetical protein
MNWRLKLRRFARRVTNAPHADSLSALWEQEVPTTRTQIRSTTFGKNRHDRNGQVADMLRKYFFAIMIVFAVAAIIYGGFVRKFLVYDNLEKFDKLKSAGITIKIPGYDGGQSQLAIQSQWFTEPEAVNAMTFDGIGLYKDGRLISKFPDLRMLKGRRPCPT